MGVSSTSAIKYILSEISISSSKSNKSSFQSLTLLLRICSHVAVRTEFDASKCVSSQQFVYIFCNSALTVGNILEYYCAQKFKK